MDITYVILIAVAALIVGVGCGYVVFLKVIKGKYNAMVDAATKEADVIKEKKLLEVKEKFLNKKSELEDIVIANTCIPINNNDDYTI
jgi:ribonuclease Y